MPKVIMPVSLSTFREVKVVSWKFMVVPFVDIFSEYIADHSVDGASVNTMNQEFTR